MRIDEEHLKYLLIITLGATTKETELILSKYNTDLQRLRIFAPIDLINYTNKVLIPEDKSFRTLFYLIALEAVIVQKQTGLKKHIRVANVVKQHLDIQDKLFLLRGFTFTGTYNFRENRGEYRHLMFDDMEEDMRSKPSWDSNNSKYCSTTSDLTCYCSTWLKNNPLKIDDYILPLFENLYSIRSAIVHEGFVELWLPDYGDNVSNPTFGAALFDAFPTESNIERFNSYESGINSEEFYRIIKEIIKRFLLVDFRK